jgi:hypothetical protein
MEKYTKIISREQITELLNGKNIENVETKRFKGVLTQYADIINTLRETHKLSYLQIHKFLQAECNLKCTYLTLLNFIKKNQNNKIQD